MSVDPRVALDRFIAALESHFHTVSVRRGDGDPAVDEAYYILSDACEVYEDALSETYQEGLPFTLLDEDDYDDDEGIGHID